MEPQNENIYIQISSSMQGYLSIWYVLVGVALLLVLKVPKIS